ncbi:hypothetical protein GGR50DRAFT_642707 [Xylaria sp. CBS 124048]|nr:hypothetical protein GGR50DRAFT_642707 [Xylaria sp. CBS 124048]
MDDSSKPSFQRYWQQSKDQQEGKRLTFISSKLGQAAEGKGAARRDAGSSEDKVKARRQQVRKAQIQHRQRKANYTQQLELDITKLRDDIAAVEREIEGLRSENGSLRSRLTGGALPTAAPAVPAKEPLLSGLGTAPDMAFSTSLAPEYTISLDLSQFEDLGLPAFQVRRTLSPSPPYSTSSVTGKSIETLSSNTPATPATPVSPSSVLPTEMALTALTEEQTDLAINFILSLERCCWNHINPIRFDHHHHRPLPEPWVGSRPPPPPGEEDDSDGLGGHTFTATSLALQNAPLEIFARINNLQIPPTTTTTTTTTSSSSSASLLAAASSDPISWVSRSLTLANLRHLAVSLNTTEAELAPVQIWFELAAMYGVAVATDPVVLEVLKKALSDEVHCVLFGATVPRHVFEYALQCAGLPPKRIEEA